MGIWTPGPAATSGDDSYNGTGDGNVALDGLAGNDTILAGDGNDTIQGGAGDDSVNGGAGNDTLLADAGADILIGGEGNDTITSGRGDSVDGGAGDDIITMDLNAPGNGFITVDGGAGNDTLVLNSGFPTVAADLLTSIEIIDVQTGGVNFDILPDSAFGHPITITTHGVSTTALYFNAGVDGSVYSLADITFANWDSANDFLFLQNLTQNSVSMTGSSLDDNITSGNGDDTLIGGAGDDFIQGGGGADIYDGGTGNDTAEFQTSDALTIDLTVSGPQAGSQGADTFVSIENLIGGNVGDQFTGDALGNVLDGNGGDDTLAGGDGDDTLIGNFGDDFLDGGVGNDTASYKYEQFTSTPQGVTVSLDITDPQDTLAFAGGVDTLANIENLIGSDYDDTLSGDGGANRLSGIAGADLLIGMGGDDTLDGGAGANVLVGGAGHDTLINSDGGDSYAAYYDESTVGGAGVTVNLQTGVATQFSAEQDTLVGINSVIGSLGNDTLTGNANANNFYGVNGSDTINGGANTAGSYDTVWFGNPGVLNVTLPTPTIGVTADLVTGVASDGGTVHVNMTNIEGLAGTASADALFGNASDNLLIGGAGDDVMDGRGGNDTALFFGSIVDYTVDTGSGTVTGADGMDQLAGVEVLGFLSDEVGNRFRGLDLAANTVFHRGAGMFTDPYYDGGTGNDDLILEGRTTFESFNVHLAFGSIVIDNGDDRTTLFNMDTLELNTNGGGDNVVLSGDFTGKGMSWIVITGDTGNNVLDASGLTGDLGSTPGGHVGMLTLRGGGGNDTLLGSSTYGDVMNGGAGADTMVGGDGHDIYYVDNVGDVVTEAANGGGDILYASINLTMPDNVEFLYMLAGGTAFGNAQDNNIIGTTGSDTIDGGGGNDVLETIDGFQPIGGAPDLLRGGDGNDILHGRLTAHNTMEGGAGDDRLYTDYGGQNVMVGGAGNDYYNVVANDTISETATGGIDTVETGSTSYTLPFFVENLVLSVTVDQYADYFYAINGTGNNLSNAITGNVKDNTLTGLAGNDTLDGGTGADTMIGGTGNDLYVVDNVGDVVTENSGEGTDTLRSNIGVSALAANVENLELLGTALTGNGNDLNNRITGNASNNTLNGMAGADTMLGGAGDDTYFVDNASDFVNEASGNGTDTIFSTVNIASLAQNVENLSLNGVDAVTATGNSFNNTITGNSTNNVLNGGAGEDTLIGGLGNDTYVVNSAGDTVTDSGGNNDTILSYIDMPTLTANIENLTLAGAALIGGGNELNNVIVGNSLGNTLTGGLGNDQLNGGTGADTMSGGDGDDSYLVENAGDVVTENANEGADTVYAFISISALAANVEKLNLMPAGGAINGTANDLDNRLNGNDFDNVLTALGGNDVIQGLGGNDHIIGGAGQDNIFGGAGNDVFVYQTISDSGTTGTARDIINDFTQSQDSIDLSLIDAITGGGDDAFTLIGASAFSHTAGELRYDQIDPTGTANDFTIISMDVNGDGVADSQITVRGALTLTSADFVL
ncbi:MAG: calcium-binding protein [Pseudomonadota bacterium]